MGRKIPAKKHRGVKDPIKQQALRFQREKTRINAPPQDPDDQPVPRSLTLLMSKIEALNKPRDKTKKKKTQTELVRHAIEKPKKYKNPIQSLKQLPGESGRAFSLRINSAVKSLSTPSQDYDELPDEFDDEGDSKGVFMDERRDKRKKKRAKDERKNGNGNSSTDKKPKLHPLQKKKEAKKIKIAEKVSERAEVQYERLGLDEIAHAPPTLTAPRKGRVIDCADRPGRRPLLLSSLLAPTNSAVVPHGTNLDLDKERRERARLDAVAAYRQLKKQKRIGKS